MEWKHLHGVFIDFDGYNFLFVYFCSKTPVLVYSKANENMKHKHVWHCMTRCFFENHFSIDIFQYFFLFFVWRLWLKWSVLKLQFQYNVPYTKTTDSNEFSYQNCVSFNIRKGAKYSTSDVSLHHWWKNAHDRLSIFLSIQIMIYLYLITI